MMIATESKKKVVWTRGDLASSMNGFNTNFVARMVIIYKLIMRE